MAEVAVLIEHDANRRLLADFLAPEHSVARASDDAAPLSAATDLVVVDRPGLMRWRSALETARADAQPLLIPVLLIVGDGDLDRRQLPEALFEDVLVVPVRKRELGARVGTLLRLRELSRRQHRAWSEAHEGLVSVNRAYRAFSACNDAVVRADSEMDLLHDVSRAVVETADYRFAWVGYIYPQGRVIPVASSDPDNFYPHRIDLRWDDVPGGQGPFGQAIREGRPAVSADMSRDDQFIWYETAREYGFVSVIVLPLRVHGRIIGALSIYAGETSAFSEAEVTLLERMVENLAYGVQARRDHVERREQQAQANYLAYRDSLTGLANRTWMSEALGRLDAEGDSPAALLFIDLDGFKVINDALGHDFGDELLRQVAQRLLGVVRDTDLVARHGGDEFLMLLRHAPRGGWDGEDAAASASALADIAVDVAGRVIDTVVKPFTLDGAAHHLACSVGISLFPRDTARPLELLSHADSAMYEAKSEGGARYQFYSPDLTARQRRRLHLAGRLHDAVEEEGFELHFQPVMDLRQLTPVAVEALIRWPQADGSMVSPGEFMPLAEDNGLIVPIGRWVLEEAGRAAAALRVAECPWEVWINVSVSQLWQPGFVEQALTALGDAGVAPDAVALEITESAMMDDPDRLTEAMNALRASGFRMALDDFGTGYSSLWRLQDLPFSVLKIDKSFVQRTPDDPRAVTLVRALVGLAHRLGLQVVAEGVEQGDQLALLRETGCDYAQGFYFARPAPLGRLLDTASNPAATGPVFLPPDVV